MSLALELVQKLKQRDWQIRCVESCTAGALTAAIGEVNGASAVLDRSWVTYSNASKVEEVGVPPSVLDTFGAVSEEVVVAMVEGAVQNCENNTASIAISGIAGPSGGTKDKPVGTVWIALKLPSKPAHAERFLFSGDRKSIQKQAVKQAIAKFTSNLS